MKNLILLTIIISTTSCSYFSGPEGMFPSTKDNFLEEKVAKDINLPPELNLKSKENHYPVVENFEVLENSAIPKPRQIFSSSGNSSVQLRRLGELMWIYVETLPSTSWPISKSFWETSVLEGCCWRSTYASNSFEAQIDREEVKGVPTTGSAERPRRTPKERVLRFDQVKLLLRAFISNLTLVSSSIIPKSLRRQIKAEIL